MMANTIWSMWGDGVLQALETLVQTRLLLCQPESWLTPSLWREPPALAPTFPGSGLAPFHSTCKLLTGNILKTWMRKRVRPLPHR